MDLTIRPLDRDSDNDIAQYSDLIAAVSEHQYGASERPTAAQTRAALASTEYWRQRAFLAIVETLEGGQMVVGTAALDIPLKENLEQAWVDLSVHPSFRGRGIGTALLENAVIPAIRESGRTVIGGYGVVEPSADAKDPSLPPARLAARLGIEHKHTAVCRALSLPIEEALLDRLEAEAVEKLGEYRIHVWRGPVPEEHLGAYGMLLHQLDLDDPDEDLEMDAAEYSPERIRYGERRLAERGMRALTAVAQAPTGELVGNTVIQWHAGEGSTLGFQENTLVMPEHRGHRLGLALKVATHRLLAAEAPGMRRLITWNSHVNPWMISINEKLGYEVIFQEPTFQGRVDL